MISATKMTRSVHKPLRPNDIPDAFLRKKILEYLSIYESCRLDTVAEEVFAFAKFGCRARNREMILSRIWAQVDELIDSGEIVQCQPRQKSWQARVRLVT
jgi:hypothetical protein